MQPAAQQTIVLIHGGGAGAWMWKHPINHLAEYHCLTTPDLPEHGSAPPHIPFSLQTAADQIAALIRHQAHGAKAHVIGISIGGTVALQLAIQSPELIESLLVSAATIGPLPGGAVISALSGIMTALMKTPFAARQTAKQMAVPDDLYPDYEAALRSLNAATYRRINDAVHNFRTFDALSQLSARVLVGCGAKEPGFVKDNQRKILSILPNAQGFIVPEAGHTWNYEQPDLFVDVVRRWVSGQSLPNRLQPLASA